mgnify:CR=1 FL=1
MRRSDQDRRLPPRRHERHDLGELANVAGGVAQCPTPGKWDARRGEVLREQLTFVEGSTFRELRREIDESEDLRQELSRAREETRRLREETEREARLLLRDLRAKGKALIRAARAGEIKVISTIGVKSVVEELAPQYERKTGHKLAITFG